MKATATSLQPRALRSKASRKQKEKMKQMLTKDEGRNAIIIVSASMEGSRCATVQVTTTGVAQQLLEEGAEAQTLSIHSMSTEEVVTAAANGAIMAMLEADAVRRAKCAAFVMLPVGRQELLREGSGVPKLEVREGSGVPELEQMLVQIRRQCSWREAVKLEHV